MSEKAQKVFNHLVVDNKAGAAQSFSAAIRDKLNDALEVRKVGLTAKIFNTKENHED